MRSSSRSIADAFTLVMARRYERAVGADNFPADCQLHGRHVVQKRRPGDRQLDVQARGQMSARIKENAAAREIHRAACAGIQHLAPAYQFPAQIEEKRIPTVSAAFTGNPRVLFSFEGTHRELCPKLPGKCLVC